MYRMIRIYPRVLNYLYNPQVLQMEYPGVVIKHSPVDAVDSVEERLLGDAGSFRPEPHPKLHSILCMWPMLSHGTLMCASLLFFALWMCTPSPYLHDDIPIYSPASGAVESTIVRFNGTLDFPSIYRGPPSPAVDAAWDRIAYGLLPTQMSLEEILKAGGGDLPYKVKYPAKFGGGFMATIEVYHQLHCLNLLRKASWPEYYGHADNTTVDRMHLDHCIEMIRKNIMCNADVTMITWDWVQGHKDPWPDFNTRHQCRNYEKIMDWAVKHAVHIDESDVTRFEDTVDLPLPFNPD
ncbi:hypothetical protein CY34DRAFT_804473 [Suillus luteus UH-Slu-Lm8-n1]|uniref:Tat pathway signal sequence n=1 Tax=Suillus luteus UH-Slu-Lm8-n1 TaxID=930992 RepID=A0A0D0BIA5_9AGAM|nr:hypothetical protein CY34DRAFT_804473 [Suillus luteus UH-Slu-Lm8-n1]